MTQTRQRQQNPGGSKIYLQAQEKTVDEGRKLHGCIALMCTLFRRKKAWVHVHKDLQGRRLG